MVIEKKRWIWGADGEFTIQKIYDVYDRVPHPDDNFYPLNAFGACMMNDYLNYNNIQFSNEVDIDN